MSQSQFNFKPYTGIAAILLLTSFAAATIHKSLKPIGQRGEHPNFFAQWYEEKKLKDGSIPQWRYEQWSKWDKQNNLQRRSGETIIDSVMPLGPANIGGRTRSIWIDPRNDNVILAAAISGGVWRSETAGTSWKPINDQQESLMASCITHNPFNPDIVYYGTGESRANSADVNGSGVFKSADGGKSFTQLTSTKTRAGFNAIWDIEHSLDDTNTLFVSTHGQGLHRSLDGGTTWEQVFVGGNNIVNDILVMPGKRILLSMQSNQVYASDSGGKKGTFKLISFPSFPNSGTYGRIQMSNCRKFPNVVYAIFEGIGFSDPPVRFYKSSNGGRTWIQRSAPSGIGPSYQTYCLMLGVNANDSNVVVAGGVNIAQSNNGGASWATKTTGHSDHHCMIPFYKNTTEFLVGNDGGVYRYRYSSGAVQADLNAGYYTTQFYAGAFGPDGLVSISGAQDNGTSVATDILKSRKFYGADGAYAHIGLQDGSIAYFSTQNQGIRRIDNFNPNIPPTFTTAIDDQAFTTDGVAFINPYLMCPEDQNALVYRTNQGVYFSNDAGSSWRKLNTGSRSSIKALAISKHSNPVLYYGGGSAQLYKFENLYTANAGTDVVYNGTVPAKITDDYLSSIVIHPNDKYTIFCGFSSLSVNSKIWKASSLDGTTPVWTDISGNLPPGLPVNSVAVDPAFPDKNIFAGTDFGLYYSTDSGKTWVKEIRIPNVAVHEIKMRDDRTLFLYTHGRGMWAISMMPLSSANVVKKSAQLRVFPNPANSTVYLKTNSAAEISEWEMYNGSGRLVSKGQQNPIDVSKMARGQYYIRVRTTAEVETVKILLKD
jgi:photosystem II stability/assembly factor-like uncharacterized protein